MVGRELWKGSIPAVFNLSPTEVTTMSPPLPFYVSEGIVPWGASHGR